MRLLIDYGADVNAVNEENDRTCLECAICNCDFKCMKFLIDKGADFDFFEMLVGDNDYLVDKYRRETINFLLSEYNNDIDLWRRNEENHNALSLILLKYPQLKACCLMDLIYQALCRKCKNEIKKIDEYLNARVGNNKDTLLHLAMKINSSVNGRESFHDKTEKYVVQYLLSIKVELNLTNGDGIYMFLFDIFLKLIFFLHTKKIFVIKQPKKKKGKTALEVGNPEFESWQYLNEAIQQTHPKKHAWSKFPINNFALVFYC